MSAFVSEKYDRPLGYLSRLKNIAAYAAVNGTLVGVGWLMLMTEVSVYGVNQQLAPYFNTVPLWCLGYLANRQVTCRLWGIEPREKRCGTMWYGYKAMEFIANHAIYAFLVAEEVAPYTQASLLATAAVCLPSYWIARLIFSPQLVAKEALNSVSPA